MGTKLIENMVYRIVAKTVKVGSIEFLQDERIKVLSIKGMEAVILRMDYDEVHIVDVYGLSFAVY